jgi:hypothetical protein
MMNFLFFNKLAALQWKANCLCSMKQGPNNVSGFPLGCFDHSSLMERDPKTTVAISFLDPTKMKFCC